MHAVGLLAARSRYELEYETAPPAAAVRPGGEGPGKAQCCLGGERPVALKILWATDGSEHADEVLPLLGAFFLPVAESVTVLAVAPQAILSRGARPDPAGALWGAVPSYREKVSEVTTQIVVEATKRLADSPAPVESDIRMGHPIDQIVTVARQTGADVIAVGSRGHSGFASLILGSVAFGVLVHAPCSVLLAKPRTPPPAEVLFATDGSEHSQRAEDLLASLAKPAGARVTVVSVAQPFQVQAGTPIRYRQEAERALAEIRRHREEEAGERAEQAAGRLRDAGWQARRVEMAGRAADGILQAERDAGAGLIVLGSHGRTGAAAYVLGSVAQAVAHHSRASVLVVKRKS